MKPTEEDLSRDLDEMVFESRFVIEWADRRTLVASAGPEHNDL